MRDAQIDVTHNVLREDVMRRRMYVLSVLVIGLVLLVSWHGQSWAVETGPPAQADEAREEEQIRQEAASRGEDPRPALAKLWLQRGLTASQHGNYPRAIAYFKQGLVLVRDTQDQAGEGILLYSLGEAHAALSQYQQAIASFEQALAIARELRNRADEGSTLYDLGLVYQHLNQHKQAVASYEQALAIARELWNRADEGTTLYSLGETYAALSQYQQAIASFEQALAIARDLQNRADEGTTLNHLGMAYQHLGQYLRAITYYDQVLAITRELQNRAGEGASLANLGSAYGDLSQYAQAITYYEQALAIQREVQDRVGEGTTLNNLGQTYAHLSQYQQAISYFEQALAIHREVQNRAMEGTTLNNLGGSYDQLSQYATAISYFEQALAIHREVQNRAMEGTTLNNLGQTYAHLSQYARAIEYYEQALAIHREVQNRAMESTTLNNLGATYQSLSQYAKAIEYYEQALAIVRTVGGRAGEGTTLTNLMSVSAHQQKPQVAIFYGKQAVNIFQAIRTDIQRLEKDIQQGFLKSKEDTYRTLANLLITESRLPEAEQVLRMLKEEELFEYVRRDQKAANSLTRIALTKTEEQWAQRYLTVADRLTALGQEKQALDKKQKTQTLSPQDEERALALEADLQAARHAFSAFMEELKTGLGDSQEAGQQIANLNTSSNLQGLLSQFAAGTVAFYTVVGKEKTWVVLVTPTIRKPVEVSLSAAELGAKVLKFREAVQAPIRDPRPLAKELYDLLVRPFEADLRTVGAQTLMWSLDGVLRYLPIAALYDGEHYLIERYQPVVFTLAGQQLLSPEQWHAWKAAGLGVSKPHPGFDSLPGVVAELRGIVHEEQSKTGVLPGMVAMDEAFTPRALQLAFLRRYPVVHIASHFQFQPGNETDSFLLLGDGTHLSIADLKGYSFAGVDLFTLSACATALGGGGDGKEIESFAMIAQNNGAKAVVASLWPVADESTKALMQTFYRLREAKKGTSKAEALQHAQLTLLQGKHGDGSLSGTRSASAVLPKDASASDSKPVEGVFPHDEAAPYAHPYYWAPFILIGNWQ